MNKDDATDLPKTDVLLVFVKKKAKKKDHLNIPTIFITLNSCHFHRIPNKKPQNWFPTILVS